MYNRSREVPERTEYHQIVALFEQDKIASVILNVSNGKMQYVLREDQLEADRKNAENPDSKDKAKAKVNNYTVQVVQLFIDDFNDMLRKRNEDARAWSLENPDAQIGELNARMVKYDFSRENFSTVMNTLYPILMVVLFIGLGIFIYRNMNKQINGETNRSIAFGKARTRKGKDEKRRTTFDDVAGADEEKEELSEIVEFLKNPQKFNEIGARIPKGVLLVGPPGTGKTLLARAVAGEADVPFFSISGSDFVEMYVGVGASRVRDLFEQAKHDSPAIIFIDEIDAVGRHRGAGMGGGHDEREQTLNQLLVEMDGFGNNEGVIILAATNRPDILDPALLRPGRFDRQVTVGYPDIVGREAILNVHAKGKPFAPDVVLNTIAKATVGFTGADLENLLNEAALLAARRGKKAITMAEIDEASIKVQLGTEKRSHKLTEKEKRLTAYHEAGHAVASYYLDSADKVHQVSIIPRGMAGGYTLHLPSEDKDTISKNEMLDRLVILLGGRVAEKLVLEDISTGASSDLQRATDIARSMITRYGMSEALGSLTY
ncbi:MAG: ATP-dependent zinc metalloprotease FtsH, partial [Oscillospiraceae bacterium]|nr:ATP-dependent zinc metalloprotease FtsH [Oscillospiraceae bacterium]